MDEPKRYTLRFDTQSGSREMVEDEDGEYVLASAYDALRAERDEFRDAEAAVSHSYLHIREMLRAYDTDFGGKNRFEVTEKAICDLKAERDALQTARDQALQDCVDMKHIKDKVAAFMETWHQRAKDAEAERDALRSRLAVLTVAANRVSRAVTPADQNNAVIDLDSALGDVGDVRERVMNAINENCDNDDTSAIADAVLSAMLPKEVRS